MRTWTTEQWGLALAALTLVGAAFRFLAKWTRAGVEFFLDLRTNMRTLTENVGRLTNDVGRLTEDVGELVLAQREDRVRNDERFIALEHRVDRLENHE